MATTFYFPSNAEAAPISPAIHSTWTRSVSLYRRKPVKDTKTNSADADQVVTDAGTNPSDECRQQWVYGPLAAQTIGSQVIKLGFMGRHGATWGFHWLTGCVWVAKPDGTLRGTISPVGDLYASNNSFPANTYETRYIEDAASASVTVQAGDYLVIEVGYHNESGSTMDTYFQLGDAHSTNVDSVDTTTERNPHLTFATSNIAFQAPTVTYPAPNAKYRRGLDAVSLSPTSSGGPVESYSLIAGALPTGVSLNTTTGVISGTPSSSTALGSYAVTVRATNEGGNSDNSLTIVVSSRGHSLNLGKLLKGGIDIG